MDTFSNPGNRGIQTSGLLDFETSNYLENDSKYLDNDIYSSTSARHHNLTSLSLPSATAEPIAPGHHIASPSPSILFCFYADLHRSPVPRPSPVSASSTLMQHLQAPSKRQQATQRTPAARP
ncbi:hypothetical protein VE03_05388 [Pseudogymnoascus sp. 23342-1-I1]|nr:hypothetical protein VE03_05388 [Pseudogymnoascus sp. 23342-1-I1]